MGWLSDIGDAVSSAAGAVGDAVEGAVNTVADTVSDAVDTVTDTIQDGLSIANTWLCQNAGSVGCWAGNIILGGISGSFEGLRDMLDKTMDVVRDVGGALGALLRGDLGGFIGKLGDLLLDTLLLGIDALRFMTLGSFIGGIVTAWQADELRNFVEDLLKQKFGSNPDQLKRIRDKLGLDHLSWGFDMQGNHKVFRLDSKDVPLWQWHKNGQIDLYSLAGVTSFDSFTIRRNRTMVRTVKSDGSESSIPTNRWTLSHYIDSNGSEQRIRVYALTPAAVKEFVQVSVNKFKKVGINLKWNDGGRWSYFSSDSAHDITTLDEYTFDRDKQGDYILKHKLKSISFPDQCSILAMAAFKFIKGLGQTSGRDIKEGSAADNCTANEGRNDHCCMAIKSSEGPGVVYHDQWPSSFMRYVLAHECGHYVGLCHYGHDGFQNIMFTPAPDVGLSYGSWGLFNYYLDNEPSFSLDDAKNVWRFLVSQFLGCLDASSVSNPQVVVLRTDHAAVIKENKDEIL